jgi:hypothetical protein
MSYRKPFKVKGYPVEFSHANNRWVLTVAEYEKYTFAPDLHYWTGLKKAVETRLEKLGL